MKNHQYNFKIEAETEKEANAKMAALTVLASKLSEKELTKLADIVAHNPVKTALAKRYLGV